MNIDDVGHLDASLLPDKLGMSDQGKGNSRLALGRLG